MIVYATPNGINSANLRGSGAMDSLKYEACDEIYGIDAFYDPYIFTILFFGVSDL